MFFIHKHYAWDPEDLIEKLSLGTQIWKNVSDIGGKITVFEINANKCIMVFFSAVNIS